MLTTAALLCLSLNAYHEARGEGPVGIHAVTNVVMNRVEDPRYPSTPCDVIYEPYQFSWTTNPPPHGDLLDILEHVVDALQLPDNTDGSTHYHTPAVNPVWRVHYTPTTEIRNHLFYRNDTPWK